MGMQTYNTEYVRSLITRIEELEEEVRQLKAERCNVITKLPEVVIKLVPRRGLDLLKLFVARGDLTPERLEDWITRLNPRSVDPYQLYSQHVFYLRRYLREWKPEICNPIEFVSNLNVYRLNKQIRKELLEFQGDGVP